MSTDDPLFAAMASSGIFSDDVGTDQKKVDDEKMEVENSSSMNSVAAEYDDKCMAENEVKSFLKAKSSGQKTSPTLEETDVQSAIDVKVSSDPGFESTTSTLETESEIGDLTFSENKSDNINAASENALKSGNTLLFRALRRCDFYTTLLSLAKNIIIDFCYDSVTIALGCYY